MASAGSSVSYGLDRACHISLNRTRYVYQTSKGGRIYCPLEHQARIIRDATPRFASQLSHKYGQLNARAVQTDLAWNHGRKVATSYIQNVAELPAPRRRTGNMTYRRWMAPFARSLSVSTGR